MKYEHIELIKAVERLERLGDFNTRVEASQKAGEIINKGLDSFADKASKEIQGLEKEEEKKKTRSMDSSMLGLD